MKYLKENNLTEYRETGMDFIKAEKTILKAIKNEYGLDNCYGIADALYNQGIYELNDDVRIKIDYLKEVCSDFSLENYWIISAVALLNIEEIKERYDKYSQVLRTKQITSNTLGLPLKKLKDYKIHFVSLGFNEIQLDKGITAIITLGGIAKDCARIGRDIEAIDMLEMEESERNQYICDNADLIYNDYSRKIPEIIAGIIEIFGIKDAATQLKEHPLWIRYGME